MTGGKGKASSAKQARSAVTLEALDHESAQQAGFFGRVPDPTPNANYSAAGNDLPTQRRTRAGPGRRRRGGTSSLSADVARRAAWRTASAGPLRSPGP